MVIISGLATTLVVWLLDQINIFSVNDKKARLALKRYLNDQRQLLCGEACVYIVSFDV